MHFYLFFVPRHRSPTAALRAAVSLLTDCPSLALEAVKTLWAHSALPIAVITHLNLLAP